MARAGARGGDGVNCPIAREFIVGGPAGVLHVPRPAIVAAVSSGGDTTAGHRNRDNEPESAPVSTPRRAHLPQTACLKMGWPRGEPAGDGGKQRWRGFRAARPAPRRSVSAAAARRQRRPTPRRAVGFWLPLQSAPAGRPGGRGTGESAAARYPRMLWGGGGTMAFSKRRVGVQDRPDRSRQRRSAQRAPAPAPKRSFRSHSTKPNPPRHPSPWGYYGRAGEVA